MRRKHNFYKWIFEVSIMVVHYLTSILKYYHIGKLNGKANVTTPRCSEMDHSEDWICSFFKKIIFPRVGSTYLIFAPLIHLKIKFLLINVRILLHDKP